MSGESAFYVVSNHATFETRALHRSSSLFKATWRCTMHHDRNRGKQECVLPTFEVKATAKTLEMQGFCSLHAACMLVATVHTSVHMYVECYFDMEAA